VPRAAARGHDTGAGTTRDIAAQRTLCATLFTVPLFEREILQNFE
jgi:hypothetical protein